MLLGDTEEYAAYRGLDRLYLWDSVQIIDSLHSIEITADVTGYTYDVLAGRIHEMTLGTTSGERGIRLISGYQIRQGSIPGSKLIHQTLGPGQIGPGYMEQVATNATGQQITVEFTSGVILDDENTSTIGTLKVYHNGIDISDLIPASAVHWQRISTIRWETLWNADPAHQNTKTNHDQRRPMWTGAESCDAASTKRGCTRRRLWTANWSWWTADRAIRCWDGDVGRSSWFIPAT